MAADADLKNTVFLPKTSFPMRGNLPHKEPEILSFWKTQDLAQKQRAARNGCPLFLLHDGPPYANGHLHIGHALNKIFKDTVNRAHLMAGADVVYIPGWDCHGLPIEAKVEENYRTQRLSKKDVDPLTFRKACRVFAEEWISVQSEEFQRMGLMGDFENPYTTMSPQEEAGIVRAFLDIFMRGDVYRGVKPVMWSVVEETALAEAEIEYKDVESSAIDVRFPLVETPLPDLQGVSCVIWTTTPWTLPANRAVAYGNEIDYVVVQVDAVAENSLARKGERLLVAQELLASFCERTGIQAHTVLKQLTGKDLEGSVAAHPFRGKGFDFPVPLLPGEHVTTDAGTGLVHTAPSHGVEDFALSQIFGLEIPETLGPSGVFEDSVPLFAGAHVYKVNPQVLTYLEEASALLSHRKILHSYPHSWRSKTPLIYRTTAQWFLRMDGKEEIREKALTAIETVQWIPAAGRTRIQSMVAGRPDWCLSRQRVWGVPIPLFLCKKTGEVLRDTSVNTRILEIMERDGTDVWWSLPAEEFLSPFYEADAFEKSTDILDVWFDSGVTHEFVLKSRGLPYPADLYLEGSDQHRGWFQSTLLTAIALGKPAPYKAVLTHGFVVDGAGRKMSKSQGNIVAPQEIIQTKGADILRLWAVSADFEGDVRIGPELIKHVEDLYRRLRNTFRYLLGALADFSENARIAYEEMPELERWMLGRLSLLKRKMQEAFQGYHFQTLLQDVHYFCSNDLSAFYFDVRKDVLYCDAADSLTRRATQTVMQEILETLVRGLAPVLAFTCEEVWQTMREELAGVFPKLAPSVHLESFCRVDTCPLDEELDKKYESLRTVRQVVTGALEQARAEKRIGSSLGAHPTVYVPSTFKESLSSKVLEDLSLTSGLSLIFGPVPSGAFVLGEVPDVGVEVALAQGQKCEKCWKVLPEVTQSHALCVRCAEVLQR